MTGGGRKVRRVLMTQVGIPCGSCRHVIPLGAACERVMDFPERPDGAPVGAYPPRTWYRCRSCAEAADG